MTLNMLRNSRTNPKLSAYAAIFVIHDFNRCPLAPPSTKLFVHDKIQEHLNRLYHPVTGQRETYEKIKLQQPKRWITILSNELGRLASGVRDIVTSGTDTIFLFTRIKSQK